MAKTKKVAEQCAQQLERQQLDVHMPLVRWTPVERRGSQGAPEQHAVLCGVELRVRQTADVWLVTAKCCDAARWMPEIEVGIHEDSLALSHAACRMAAMVLAHGGYKVPLAMCLILNTSGIDRPGES